MKIIVPIKRVVDYNVRVRVRADGQGVETSGLKMSINPFDEIAVEEAVRLSENGSASEVVVVSIGGAVAQDTLRSAMAIGAHRAILVVAEEEIQPIDAARILQKLVEQENPKLVITGKQAIDDDASQTGQMLAGLLGWPQGTFTSKLVINGESAHATREVDGGLVTLNLLLPAVITTDLRLNEPRYASLPNIMKARSKPLAKTTPQELGIDIKKRVNHLKYEEPAKRNGGRKVASVAELVEKIKNVVGD